MTTTFINKVSAERKILTIINSKFSRNTELTGLTKYAIEKWAQKTQLTHEDKVVVKLKSLGTLCQRLSDRSQESFNSLDQNTMETIEMELTELKYEINSKYGVTH